MQGDENSRMNAWPHLCTKKEDPPPPRRCAAGGFASANGGRQDLITRTESDFSMHDTGSDPEDAGSMRKSLKRQSAWLSVNRRFLPENASCFLMPKRAWSALIKRREAGYEASPMSFVLCCRKIRLENVNRQELITTAESSSSMHDTRSDPESEDWNSPGRTSAGELIGTRSR